MYRRRDDDVPFRERWDEIKGGTVDSLEGSTMQRAINGVVRRKFATVYRNGVKHTVEWEEREYPERTAMFLLQSLKPELYRPRRDAEGVVRSAQEEAEEICALVDAMRGSVAGPPGEE